MATPTITSGKEYAEHGESESERKSSAGKILIAFSVSFYSVGMGTARGLPSRIWQDSVAK